MTAADRDPRSTLGGPGRTPTEGTPPKRPSLFEFATISGAADGGAESWWIRSQSMVLAYTRATAGVTLTRRAQADEYLALFPDPDARAKIRLAGEAVRVAGRTIAVVPPGESELEVEAGGEVVRLFTGRSPDLLDRCLNASDYLEPDPNVKAFEPWPEPPGGSAVRLYHPDEAPADPGRFGRIFRCRTLMVNYFPPEQGARRTDRLSPHHHDDFEQISLQLSGEYVHHLRTPWGADLDAWRPDEHLRAQSPAALVIPPPLIHTSRAVGDHAHQLIDLFAPPRLDFSARPGWVLNAADYPPPASLKAG